MVTQYNQTVVVDAIVVNDTTAPFLIGEDWMYDVGAKIDFVTSELKYYDGETRIIVPFELGHTGNANPNRSKISTQTRRTLDLPVAAPEGTEGLFIPKLLGKTPELLLTPTMTTVRNGVIRVSIPNIMGSRRRLPKHTAVGTWSPSEQDMDILWNSEELKPSRVTAWLSELSHHKSVDPIEGENELDIEESLNSGERKTLMSLLRNYRGLLEKKSECPPMTTTGVQHHINTGSNPPIRCRQRRYAQSELTVIDEQVDKMLADQVIEECNGPWAFPVVLVKKKDGTIRFCIDYRSLNAVTVKDVYPLPRIDETLDHLPVRGTRYFTTLDLHSGYWQVGVAEVDKDKTAFSTRKGLFRCRRMSFGLANAPGTFQCLMDAVLRGLSWQCCMVYLDDIIIYTKGTFERHIVELTVVLERLANAGLSLKPEKCSFAKQRLEYLGHELTKSGI
ncbi:LOW QUALITY PROTEIN: Retrovirus-related Pol Polyprotein [Phytophthora palmivora]|uniref:Retrovirus-related Pol Polyprotein n=1 Tax=Phytophthora palmivora TaxID=4796 RepID=A0A2P4Y843_9STRA|nr:LOW QUALITY PROTEIN: Retrovirus-related Pol Polyprotein [Phytophthora palmivora]